MKTTVDILENLRTGVEYKLDEIKQSLPRLDCGEIIREYMGQKQAYEDVLCRIKDSIQYAKQNNK